MAMRPFTFTVTAQVERESGKFMSREEVEQQLFEALEQADPVTLGADGDSVYAVSEWDVQTA